jgi:hypothetical protein
MYACLFDQPERINDEVARYLAVGTDEVRDGVAATLRADNRLVLTYVPAEAPMAEAPGAEAPGAEAPGGAA